MDLLYLLGCFLTVLVSCKAEDAPPLEDSWSKLQISPQAIASMPYMNFRINIYRDSGKLQASQGKPKYFYAPLSALDPQSAYSRRNNVTNEFEMGFQVHLWSQNVEIEIAKYLSTFLGEQVKTDQVQVIPFEKVILASTVQNDNYKVSSEWIPYQFHQDLWFKIICYRLETCDSLAEQMRFNPGQFSHLKLQFSLDSQQSRRKETIIRVENIQSGSLFSELNQRFPKADEVLLTAADAKRLVSESATNVILESFSDEEIVAQQAQSPVYSLLEKLMIAGREAISSDSSERWSSVFWDKDNYRPDKTTKTINDVYRNSVKEARDKLREVVSSSAKTSVEIGIQFKGFGFNSGFTREDSNSNEKEKENFLKTIQEGKDSVQWEGEKFSPRPMVLSRVNMAKIRNSQTLQDLKTQVTYTKAVLSTAINTPRAGGQFRLGDPWDGVKAELENQISALKAQVTSLDKSRESQVGNLQGQLGTLREEVTSLSQSVSPLLPGITDLVSKSKTPVYFSVYRMSNFETYNKIVTYSGTWVNVGEAMDINNGYFTAPYRGIYHFTFNGHFKAGTWMSLILEVNYKPRAATGHHGNYASAGMSQTLELAKGDFVAVKFLAGSLYDNSYNYEYQGAYYGTQFTGMLLHNME